jgi:hypothetical protein
MPQYESSRELEEEAKKRRDEGAASEEEQTPELELGLEQAGGNRALASFLAQGPEEEQQAQLPVDKHKLDDEAYLEPLVKKLKDRPVGELPTPAELNEIEVPQKREAMGADRLRAAAKSRLRPLPTATNVQEQEALLDRLCKGVADTWKLWQNTAILVGASVNGANVVGGDVLGPDVAALVRAVAAGGSPADQEAAAVFASAFGDAFTRWQASIKVPGLPLFPDFVYYRGALAPPTPSLPTPIKSLAFNADSFDALPKFIYVDNEATRDVLLALAMAIGPIFREWLERTLILSLVGTGPVPSYAPPSSPGGPVSAGFVIGAPGFLQTG